MKFGSTLLHRSVGKILGHNIAGLNGKRALSKGKVLTAEDIDILRKIGRTNIYVAELEPDDIDENSAAQKIASASVGAGIKLTRPNVGGVTLKSEWLGVLRVDQEALAHLNQFEEIGFASIPGNSVVKPKQSIAKIKIIPFAIPNKVLEEAERAALGNPLIYVDQLSPRKVSLILTGSSTIKDRLRESFEPALRTRIEYLGSNIGNVEFVPADGQHEENLLAEELLRQIDTGADLILLAGETAIMDRGDIAPQAIEAAGGSVISLGAPVEPGNLLMLADLKNTPVLGVPGCARSRKANVVDWLLPRLLVGEQMSRADIVALGYGGFLHNKKEL